MEDRQEGEHNRVSTAPEPEKARRLFRFGVGPAGLTGSGAHATAAGWRALARKLEDLGYSALNVGDHLDDRLAPLPALAVAGSVTSNLRLGVFMLANDYRHPAVLAKELATVDALSSGRLEAGLGAGWLARDYAAAGIEFDPPSRRIARLAEAVSVLKALFTQEEATFSGQHYSIDRLTGLPRPARRPWPTLVLGGGGRRVLTLAAQQADVVSFNVSLRAGRLDAPPGDSASEEAVARRVQWVRQAAGHRYRDIESHIYAHVVEITDDRASAAEAIGRSLGLSPAAVLRSPHVLVGAVGQIVDDLCERRERFGFSYIGVSARVAEAFAPVVARLSGQC
jgi:probable F420-dependent oxidoreductase